MTHTQEMQRLTPEQARNIDLPTNPFTRFKRIQELAQPLGGLVVDVRLGEPVKSAGGLFAEAVFAPLDERFNIPTRRRLVRKAWNVQYNDGVRAFMQETGFDAVTAAIGYGLERLDESINGVDTGARPAHEVFGTPKRPRTQNIFRS